MPIGMGAGDEDEKIRQSFFDKFSDNVQRSVIKRGGTEAAWEDIWLTLIDTPATAKILQERGVNTSNVAKDIEYSLHFGRPEGVEAKESFSKDDMQDAMDKAVREITKAAEQYLRMISVFESEEHMAGANIMAQFFEKYLEAIVAGAEGPEQKLKAKMVTPLVENFILSHLDVQNAAAQNGIETLSAFIDFISVRKFEINTSPRDELLLLMGDSRGEPTPLQLVQSALRASDPFIQYTLHRAGMVAPDDYSAPCKMPPDAIKDNALKAYQYTGSLREKKVSSKHVLAVMLDDWSIIKHLKMLEEPEIEAAGKSGEKLQSVFTDYSSFFAKVRKAIEPEKNDEERFRTQQTITSELQRVLHEAESAVANGPDELASCRLFGELLKVREVKDALIAGGLTQTQLDRWADVLGKSEEKAKQEETDEKPKEVFKVKDEELAILLERFGRNLTKDAMLQKLDSVVGRESETDQMVEVGIQRNRSNGLLLGEAGVGKSAMFSALAQRIASGQVPEKLLGSEVYELDIQGMNEGAMYVGMFEARLKPILEGIAERNRAKDNSPAVICMDEIAENMAVGGISKASEILKPILSKGGLVTFAATTQDEYQKTIRRDKAFDRRFQVIHIDQPDIIATISILENSQRKSLEDHYKIEIPSELLGDVARLTNRFLANRNQPDISITILDQACAKAKIAGHDELKLEDVMVAVAKAAHIDPNFIQHSDENILLLEEKLKQRVLGQEDAIGKIGKTIVTANAGLNDPDKPLGSFLMLGPTGVGKTETGRGLAEEMHGDKDALIRIDMGKYMEKHSLSGLIGSPPGYVDSDKEGELTGQVRKKPYSVVLFDEVDKAHPDFFKLLLSILEEGEMVAANGERINFRNTVILMTSNQRDVNVLFPPEVRNRIDEVLDYNPLAREQIHQLVDREVEKVSDRMHAQWGLKIALTENAKDQIAERGFNPEYGARELKREIKREISDPIARWLLENKAKLPKTGTLEISDLDNFAPRVSNVIPFVPPTVSKRARSSANGSRSRNPKLAQETLRVEEGALVINLNGSSVKIVGIDGQPPEELLKLLGVKPEAAEQIKAGELPATLKIGVSHGK